VFHEARLVILRPMDPPVPLAAVSLCWGLERKGVRVHLGPCPDLPRSTAGSTAPLYGLSAVQTTRTRCGDVEPWSRNRP